MNVVKCVIAYMVALFGPVIYFSTTLKNESNPILPWIVCPIIYALAGAVSGYTSKGDNKDLWKWIAWSIVVGLVAAVLFTVAK